MCDLIMLHSRLSVRPGSGIRKSTVHEFTEEDNSNYTSNLGDCVLALSDCHKQVSIITVSHVDLISTCLFRPLKPGMSFAPDPQT